jgi:hypothetical protein
MPSSVRQGYGSHRGRRRASATVAGAIVAALIVAGVTAGATDSPVSAAATGVTSAYVPVGPLRLADTRLTPCGCSDPTASTITVDIAGHPGIPDGAVAASVVVTATPVASPGFVTVHPSGVVRPLASTLNTRTDRVVANSTIVQLGTDGALALYRHTPGDLIVDVTGVFVEATTARAGRFVPVTSRRIADTRDGVGGTTGPIGPDGDLAVPLPDGVPADATALAVTVTGVGDEAPGFVASRRTGDPVRSTSFLNVNGNGGAVAATAILPVSASGLTLRSHHRGHLVVDLLGWFTGPSAPDSTDGLFVPMTPQRLLDTRATGPRAWPGGTVEVDPAIADAAALVTNVTATAADRAGFITAYPARTPRPGVSTVNPAMHDHTLANLAITTPSNAGLAYFASSGADVIVDVTGRFTGTGVTATEPPAANAPGRSRVFMVGDSTLAAVPLYWRSQSAFIGFDGIVDAASCRRLSRPSCLSNVTGIIPNTAVEAILGTPGTIDILVVKAGYNDWFSDFPAEFDAVVRAGRAKGAHTIVWMNFTEEGVNRPRARQAYLENNIDLHWLVTLPQYSDVLLADWRAYVRSAPANWTYDGTHLTEFGSWLATDYISRWIAAVEHRPCPAPWGPGGPVFTPCPKPELIGAVPDVLSLY